MYVVCVLKSRQVDLDTRTKGFAESLIKIKSDSRLGVVLPTVELVPIAKNT